MRSWFLVAVALLAFSPADGQRSPSRTRLSRFQTKPTPEPTPAPTPFRLAASASASLSLNLNLNPTPFLKLNPTPKPTARPSTYIRTAKPTPLPATKPTRSISSLITRTAKPTPKPTTRRNTYTRTAKPTPAPGPATKPTRDTSRWAGFNAYVPTPKPAGPKASLDLRLNTAPDLSRLPKFRPTAAPNTDNTDKGGLSDDDLAKIRKAVSDFRRKPPTLSQELLWLKKQCKGDGCQALDRYLAEMPLEQQAELSSTLKRGGVGNPKIEKQFQAGKKKKKMRKLSKSVESVLGKGKNDEFQARLELETRGDVDKFKLDIKELQGQATHFERVGNLILVDHDIVVAEIGEDAVRKAKAEVLKAKREASKDADDGGSFTSLFFFPSWLGEDFWKALMRLFQGNIDYWPVRSNGSGRRVDVPYEIANSLSSDRRFDVAEALARMCLETALPLPDYMVGSNFARALITALVTSSFEDGAQTCADVIDILNDATGDNMGDDFILNLIPRTSQTSYINYRFHESRCSSPVGMKTDGPNNVNVANWCSVGSLMHETLHSLGFYHQQSRSNRDNHVDVLWENIQDDKEHNYEKKSFLVGGTPYDYFSILHYSRINGFSIGGQPTMNATPFGVSPTDPSYSVLVATYNGAMGQRDGLSEHDLDALHGVY